MTQVGDRARAMRACRKRVRRGVGRGCGVPGGGEQPPRVPGLTCV